MSMQCFNDSQICEQHNFPSIVLCRWPSLLPSLDTMTLKQVGGWGWMDCFKTRHNIVIKAICGDIAVINIKYQLMFCKKIKKLVHGHSYLLTNIIYVTKFQAALLIFGYLNAFCNPLAWRHKWVRLCFTLSF